MNLLFLLLQAQTTATKGPGIQSLVFLVLIIVVFYFFMIRPQVKKQKEMTTYRSSLKKGDKVTIGGGIYGKINDVKERTVTIEIADNVIVKVDKTAIVQDNSETDGQAKK